MEGYLSVDQLGLMQKCVAKVKEATDILHKHGVAVYRVTDISIIERQVGSATLEITLDFREENRI